MFHFLLLILRFNTWIDPNSIDNKQDGRWDRKINFLPRNLFLPFFMLESDTILVSWFYVFNNTRRYHGRINEFHGRKRCPRIGHRPKPPRLRREVQFHKTRKCWYPANKLLVWLTFSVNAVWMLATSCKFDRVTRLLLLHLVVYGRDGTSFKSIDIARGSRTNIA